MILPKESASTRYGWLRAKRVLFVFLIYAFSISFLSHDVLAQQKPVDIDKVKSAFLLNFAKFVVWPGPLAKTPKITFCIFEGAGLKSYLKSLAGKAINNQKLNYRLVETFSQIEGCHVLFIDDQVESEAREKILASASGGILLVGETTDFAKQGGIIGFVLDNNRIRFEINAKAADQHSLVIKASLLELASKIY